MLKPLPNPGDTIQILQPTGPVEATVEERHDDEVMVWYDSQMLIAPLHLDRATGNYYCPESALKSNFDGWPEPEETDSL